MNTLALTVCKDAEEAIAEGYVYRPPEYVGLILLQAVVIQNGTKEGNPTVDLILLDPKTGQKYVAMTTGALLKMIPL